MYWEVSKKQIFFHYTHYNMIISLFQVTKHTNIISKVCDICQLNISIVSDIIILVRQRKTTSLKGSENNRYDCNSDGKAY